MTRKKNDTWDGTVAHARALQEALAERVQLKDGFAKPLATIGGVTVSAEDEGARLRAVAGAGRRGIDGVDRFPGGACEGHHALRAGLPLLPRDAGAC
jgi:hypothetical protein